MAGNDHPLTIFLVSLQITMVSSAERPTVMGLIAKPFGKQPQA